VLVSIVLKDLFTYLDISCQILHISDTTSKFIIAAVFVYLTNKGNMLHAKYVGVFVIYLNNKFLVLASVVH